MVYQEPVALQEFKRDAWQNAYEKASSEIQVKPFTDATKIGWNAVIDLLNKGVSQKLRDISSMLGKIPKTVTTRQTLSGTQAEEQKKKKNSAALKPTKKQKHIPPTTVGGAK